MDILRFIVIPLLTFLITIGVAIGWYKAKFTSLCEIAEENKRKHEAVEKRVNTLEHDMGRKVDAMMQILVELKTKVDLMIDGRISSTALDDIKKK